MNKRQIILLWAIAIALSLSVVIVRMAAKPAAVGSTKRKPGQTLLESFPAKEIVKIHIDGGASSVTLDHKDGKWSIAERDNYPANNSYVNDFLRALNDLEITRGIEAGPSFAARFGMDESAKTAEDHGLIAAFFDASGKERAKVALGKNITTAKDEVPMLMDAATVGRYIRNYADESGFYATSEMFPSVSSDPARWLTMDFINLEKVKSIAVTQEGKTEIAWKISRDSEEAPQFKLDNAKPEEVLNTTVAQPLNEIFSYARFDDVLPAAEIDTKVDSAKLRTVVIATFEGFTYNITLAPPKTASDPNAEILYATVSLTADIAKERTKEKDEKPEETKTRDEAFTKRKQQLEEKLAKERLLAGRTFVIAKSSVEALLKSRAELTAKPAPTPGAGAPANAQPFPGGAIINPAMFPAEEE